MKNFEIVKAMSEKRLRQFDISSALDCSPTMVSRIINGQLVPTKRQKDIICNLLDKNYSELGFSPYPEKTNQIKRQNIADSSQLNSILARLDKLEIEVILLKEEN